LNPALFETKRRRKVHAGQADPNNIIGRFDHAHFAGGFNDPDTLFWG
jgi:hypothetical protein